MAKFKVTAFRVEGQLNLSALPSPDAFYKDCVLGNELTTGLIKADPAESSFIWKCSPNCLIMRFKEQKRKVNKDWLMSTWRKRTEKAKANYPNITQEQLNTIYDQVNAELWEQTAPKNSFGWVAYYPAENILLVCASPRAVERVTTVLRIAWGSVKIEAYLQPSAFSNWVKEYCKGESDDQTVQIDDSLALSAWDGSTCTFSGMTDIEGRQEVLEAIRLHPEVESCGLMVDGYGDGTKATRYSDFAIPFEKDKQDDLHGTIVVQADLTIRLLEQLADRCAPYVTEKGVKL